MTKESKKRRLEEPDDADKTPTGSPAAALLTPQEESNGNDGYFIPFDQIDKPLPEERELVPSDRPELGDLQYIRPEDKKHFSILFDSNKTNSQLSNSEARELRLAKLIIKVKNGSPSARKTAMRQLTDNARTFGPDSLFSLLLPLLTEPTVSEQERHLLVKLIGRILYKLDDLVRPYTHKILAVLQPLLLDNDQITRIEAREIVSTLSKAAGLPHMISTLRPDIDNDDPQVRDATAKTLAIVATSLGLDNVLPFIDAVCHSKRKWEARFTGLKTVREITVLVGVGILPYLSALVECAAFSMQDERTRLKVLAVDVLSSLAETASPYGIESFEPVLKPLWLGIRKHSGRPLTSFIRCVGNIVPLMDPEDADYYTKRVMNIVVREFSSPDEQMKLVVLKVLRQCVAAQGIENQYILSEILPPFFREFWTRRMALDARNRYAVIETTEALAQRVGVSAVIEHLVAALKNESEPFRRMAVQAMDKIITNQGGAEIPVRIDSLLIDGLLYAFQQQTIDDNVILNGFGTVATTLGTRMSPFVDEISSIILWRLDNASLTVRIQAADLIARLAAVIRECERFDILSKMGTVLYEQLGEEYPEILGSVINSLNSILLAVGIEEMAPPVSDLVPRITPILRNRHEKVQENSIKLIGNVANDGPESISAREWMRICFELLEMLKAPQRAIRRAANDTFGYIAQAIGPQDVLVALMNNLRVQERQLRICSAVAIGIVAETCAPFTVLPALMNEYRVPEIHVQNGVLKALSFMFEYIGDLSKDYVYAIAPLLEDALLNRDKVHRQTAATATKHLALGCIGLGCEDVMLHLLNLLIPNVFESSPHVIERILEGIDGVRACLGPGIIMDYTLAGLFHPARKVRTPYWSIYNSMYVQSADAMVPYYPEIEEISRPELLAFI
ncbi:hypothetical protein CANCADRAFT_140918 [Tortispora caseinolytica NRRL Y-17796]|uniref:Phosphatase PP2A regulatory subunit A/Splicing factor 3B subunit 1-like HEAT repeat domain-containing protein n=1 Tax=Tortispora caseinolytica NRRL Y-17796 TaxID=767744 RepID=A0A1E4TCU6_9ASCO|nr:hypothetical protein CANCADRAFT_140918 [Tortispora caseinolytica NRRL Y-17796]